MTLLAGATLFYFTTEGWSLIDSLYFSVMTMSTIGYGDLVPTTALSKIFTIIYSILSIGFFVAVVTKVVRIVLEHKQKKSSRRKDNASSTGK
jgi:voltage-gated potassium channel Kch